MTRPTPPLPDGLFEYTYTDDEDGEVVTCYLEFHPDEVFAGVHCKAGATLWHAYKEGVDTYNDISAALEYLICQDALKEYLSRND
jgi:hypothetical protein